MGLETIIANIDNAVATSNLIESVNKREDKFLNLSSPMDSARATAESYMLLKRRVPMVIEYYKEKPTSNNIHDCMERVEMQINPQRLNIQMQKIISKQYTRGGIFYHHYGDDHASMQLSGSVGLLGMKGIEDLEKIYYHSGALLKYKNLGINKVQSDAFKPATNEQYNNAFQALDYILSGDMSPTWINNCIGNYNTFVNKGAKNTLTSDAKNQAIISYILGNYKNIINDTVLSSKYSEVFYNVLDYINAGAESKNTNYKPTYVLVKNKCFAEISSATAGLNIHNDLIALLAEDMTKAIQEYYDMKAQNDSNSYFVESLQRDFLNNRAQALASAIEEIRALNNSSTVSSNLNEIQDIIDDYTDEWTPRSVFIYFEDRVYIGHFDSFSYQRVAETPAISYDMKFTITKQIIVTSKK